MKTSTVPGVASLALLLAVGPLMAGTPINTSRSLQPDGRVHVENVKGRIEVRAWDRPEVRIEGTLAADAERLEIVGGGRDLRVRVKYPDGSGVGRMLRGEREGSTLRLMVPLRAELELSGVSADILAWGVAPSSLRIENVSGDTTVAGAPGEIRVESVSGDVDLTVNRSRVNATNVSGDIRISGKLGDELRVETVSGDVGVRVLERALGRIEGATVSGDLDVRTALAPRARVRLESVSGDIALHLPRAVSAEVRAESFSGELRAPGARVERPDRGPGASLRHRYGDGDAEVSLETFSGDAVLQLD